MATTETSIKAYLDSLSQLPGSILYRDDLSWNGLPPGDTGQVLAVSNEGLPYWKDPIPAYVPAMMEFAGSSYYRRTSVTMTNASWTFLLRFRQREFDTNRGIFQADNGALPIVTARTYGDGKMRLLGLNSAAGLYLNVQSLVPLNDDELHYIFAEYNRGAGTLTWLMDGQNIRDTSWGGDTVLTANLPTGGSGQLWLGHDPGFGSSFRGQIGCHGFTRQIGIDWNDFMTASGVPKPIDHATWSQFITQPLAWNESAYMPLNRGSLPNYAATNAPPVADPLDWI